MASYLQIENISKSYGPKVLFDHISFHVNEGDKIALIAPNGTGKTSLMRILAGKDKSDSGGKILFLKDIRIAFLEQEYAFDPEAGVLDQVLRDSTEWTASLDEEGRAAYELRVRQLLTSFHLGDFGKRMKELSGGEVKRVALTRLLASEADFLIMDEPTNHLDIDAIEFLEGYLSRSRCTLLMVTHDRYFLDRVCNIVMEMDHGNAFLELKERSEQVYRTTQVSLAEMGTGARLGTKIINCRDVSFYYGGQCYLDRFTYNFQRYEKVGIVGGNGAGKTTFLNLLTGRMDPDDPGELTGVIDRGESLQIGYYRQEGMRFDEDQTVLETVNDTRLLGQFLFTHDMLNTRVRQLSGGEKRRLYLLTILMKNPNLLILDEPTNDLDIVTLNVLEEYLLEYKGSLIIVSHDRHFLDRLVDHLFVFCGNGVVKDFIGKYSEYRTFMKDYEAGQKSAARASSAPKGASASGAAAPARKKLSFNEKREFEALEGEIEALTAEKASLEEQMNSGALPYDALQAATLRYGEVSSLLDEKELRWLELSERA